MISDGLSQGAQGVSIPTPNVNTPAPPAANAPINSNVRMEAFNALKWLENTLICQQCSTYVHVFKHKQTAFNSFESRR